MGIFMTYDLLQFVLIVSAIYIGWKMISGFLFALAMPVVAWKRSKGKREAIAKNAKRTRARKAKA